MKHTNSITKSIAVIICLTSPLSALTIMTNDQKAIVAMGSLPIEGNLYDVSFDGSFGTKIFFGNELVALSACRAIAGELNYLGDHRSENNYYFPWMFPTLANESGYGYSGTGTYYEVTYQTLPESDPNNPNQRNFFYSTYGAGWIYPSTSNSSIGENPNYVEATFRIAIPGSIPNTIPEPSIALFSILGLLPLVKRKRS